jgi:hypothetical protein
VLLLFASTAFADVLGFTTVLSGAAESPPNGSPGTGFVTVFIDTVAHTMRIEASFSGLTAPTMAAHIHCCTPDAFTGTAGVATTTPSFVGFPIGVTSGTFFTVLDLTVASSWNQAFITAQGGIPAAEAAFVGAMGAGKTYFNIHTTAFPNGEIRGFLVPEPSTLVLAGFGLLGLLALGYRVAAVRSS